MSYDFTLPYKMANAINIENKLDLSHQNLIMLIEALQSLGSNKQIIATTTAFKTLKREELLIRISKISALSKLLERTKLRSRENDISGIQEK